MHRQSSHEEIECWDGYKIVEASLIKWTDQSSNAILSHFLGFFSMRKSTLFFYQMLGTQFQTYPHLNFYPIENHL